MLAIVFGLEKFHHYTYGAPTIQVITDHKPLVAIHSKPLSKAPKRLQSMMLRMQPYDVSLQYRPGPELVIADCLSRAPLQESTCTESVQVNNLMWCPVSKECLDVIRNATSRDEGLKKDKLTSSPDGQTSLHNLNLM